MSLDDRYRWIIDEDAGVKDVVGRPRVIAVGIEDGRVILAIAVPDGDGLDTDTRAWASLPNRVADQLGYNLQSAADINRQQDREP